ncbi:hypothetical protein ACQPZF_36070 [Actinosynnema sp. CS-041913]|uniref:hypothetical protein n=1 Tax=Actinosynnema sp. CS-041913 TaxID=3239917 RepID=UPI003D91E010
MSPTDTIAQLQAELEELSGPVRVPPLTRLGQALAQRSLQIGPDSAEGLSDIDAAIEVVTEAHGYTTPDGNDRGRLAALLGLLLSVRHAVRPVVEDREAGIRLLEEAVAAPDLAAPPKLVSRFLLGQFYFSRALAGIQELGSSTKLMTGGLSSDTVADVDRAAIWFREVIDDTPTENEINEAARGMLALTEAMQTVAGGVTAAELDMQRLIEVMTTLQKLQTRFQHRPEAQEMRSFPSSIAFRAMQGLDSLDRPAEVVSQVELDSQAGVDASRQSIALASVEVLTEELAQHLSVYLDTDDPNRVDIVLAALRGLYESEGLVMELLGEPKISSWWGRFRVRAREASKEDGVVQRVAKIEHAIEVVGLRQPMAVENSKQAEAVSALVASLEKIDNAVMMVGSVVMIKYTDDCGHQHLFTKTLSVAEVRAFEENQHLLASPQEALQHLHLLARASDERIARAIE